LVYCKKHITAHSSATVESGFGSFFYCANQKIHGRYDGNLSGGKPYGCGIFIWPSGKKTMREYANNVLVSERPFKVEEQVQELLDKKTLDWKKNMSVKEQELENMVKKRINEVENLLQEESAKLKTKEEKMKLEVSNEKAQIENQLQEALANLKTKEENMKLAVSNEKAQIEKQLEEEKVKLSKQLDAFEHEKKQMEILDEIHDGIVTLDVGGTLYKTSISTLKKCSTFFQGMFSGRYSVKKDANGAIFIDRDGKIFDYILKFLRNGSLGKLSEEQRDDLWMEAEYYQIESLLQYLQK